MADDRLRIWETLFQRALELIDSVSYAGITLDETLQSQKSCLADRSKSKLQQK